MGCEGPGGPAECAGRVPPHAGRKEGLMNLVDFPILKDSSFL